MERPLIKKNGCFLAIFKISRLCEKFHSGTCQFRNFSPYLLEQQVKLAVNVPSGATQGCRPKVNDLKKDFYDFLQKIFSEPRNENLQAIFRIFIQQGFLLEIMFFFSIVGHNFLALLKFYFTG